LVKDKVPPETFVAATTMFELTLPAAEVKT